MRHRHDVAPASLHEHLGRRWSEVPLLEEDREAPLHQRSQHLCRHHLERRREHIQFLTEPLHRLISRHLARLDPAEHLKEVVVEDPPHRVTFLVGSHVKVLGTPFVTPDGRTSVRLVRVEVGDASGCKIHLPLHPMRSHHAREHGNFCRYVGVLLNEVQLPNGRQRIDARTIAPLVGSPLQEATNNVGHVIVAARIEDVFLVDQDVGGTERFVSGVNLLRVVAARHPLLDGMEHPYRHLLIAGVVAVHLLAELLGERFHAPLPRHLLKRHVGHLAIERCDPPLVVLREGECLRRDMLEHKRRVFALEHTKRTGADDVPAEVEFVNLRVEVRVRNGTRERVCRVLIPRTTHSLRVLVLVLVAERCRRLQCSPPLRCRRDRRDKASGERVVRDDRRVVVHVLRRLGDTGRACGVDAARHHVADRLVPIGFPSSTPLHKQVVLRDDGLRVHGRLLRHLLRLLNGRFCVGCRHGWIPQLEALPRRVRWPNAFWAAASAGTPSAPPRIVERFPFLRASARIASSRNACWSAPRSATGGIGAGAAGAEPPPPLCIFRSSDVCGRRRGRWKVMALAEEYTVNVLSRPKTQAVPLLPPVQRKAERHLPKHLTNVSGVHGQEPRIPRFARVDDACVEDVALQPSARHRTGKTEHRRRLEHPCGRVLKMKRQLGEERRRGLLSQIDRLGLLVRCHRRNLSPLLTVSPPSCARPQARIPFNVCSPAPS